MTPDEALAIYNTGPKAVVKILCDFSNTIESQQQEIKGLEAKVAKLSKNSSNSSKPPSSDITTPKRKKNGKRKIGGQPGHERHERSLFSQEEVDKVHPYILPVCPDCHGEVTIIDGKPRIIQQIELVEVPLIREEHRSYPVWCPTCNKIHYMPFPPEVYKEGLFKERLTATVAYMKHVLHASFSTIRKYIRDVLGEKVSRGYLRKIIEKVSQSLAAYRKYMKDFNVSIQFCIAHLIRDIRFLTTLKDPETKAYGQRLLDEVKNMFRVIHDRENMTPETFTAALDRAKDQIMTAALNHVPSKPDKNGKEQKREAQNMANRFRLHGPSYFEFITTPGMDPTNNVAEQAIRFVVIDRHVTQGTRSEKGRKTNERLWTVIATCALQGRSAFNFILKSVRAYFHDQPAPSLLLDST
jgi:hypothetical protein